MTPEDFIKYNKITGSEIIRMTGAPQGMAAIQVLEPGEGIIVFPLGTLVPGQPAPLETVRSAVWEGTKARREAVINGGLDIPGAGRLQTDLESRVNIAGSAVAAQLDPNFSETWKNEANEEVVVTPAQMIQIALYVRSFVSAVHARSRELSDQIVAATTVQELFQIDIDAGWPESSAQ
jgi:hypothetical protein